MRIAFSILFSAIACGFAHGQSFTLVGVPSNATGTTGEGLSADGLYAAGGADRSDGYKGGWYWTLAGGRVDLRGPGLPNNTRAHGVSPEGEWLVGEYGAGGSTSPVTAYRYNRITDQYQTLGNIAGYARSVSTDASLGATTVVGYHESVSPFNRRAFRWTESGGMQSLGSLPGDIYSEAAAVNTDGTRVVGVSGTANGNAFLWTSTTGMTLLPRIAGGDYGRAMGINSTGDLVVGYCGLSASPANVAVLWRNGVPENLGVAPGYARTLATSISDDGSVIVGQIGNGSVITDTAGIWTPSTGWLRLQDYMQSIGVSIPEGMNLQIANGVSADGRTIVGTSFLNHREGFVITIPAPASLGLLAFGIGALWRRR